MKKYVSPILCLLAAMIWGFAFTAQKSASLVPAFTIGALRSIFAFIFLLCIIPILDRLKGENATSRKALFTKREILGGTLCGIVLATGSALQQFGIGEGTDAGKAAFITALYVVLVPIVSSLFGKKTGLRVWISVMLAAIGFYLLCIKGDLTLTPSDALVLICSFVFCMHIIVIDLFSDGTDGVRMSCVQFLVCFIANSVMALVFDIGQDPAHIIEALPSLLYLGIFSSCIAYTLQIVAQKDTHPTVASIILSLESVFGVIGGALFLGEVMSPREYLGCIVVLLAVLLSQIDVKALMQNILKSK